MKKTIIFLICIVSMLTTKAQTSATSAGKMMVGGALGIQSYSWSGGDSKGSEFTFRPSFGYFISDNLAIGGELIFVSGSEDDGPENLKHSSFGFAPFVRYYKFTSNKNFAFFGEASIGFLSGKEDDYNGVTVTEVKNSGFGITVSPGFSYFFNDSWALDFSLPLLSIVSTDPNKDVDDDEMSEVNFGLKTFSPSLGFRYHF